jgi:hypothetical protein
MRNTADMTGGKPLAVSCTLYQAYPWQKGIGAILFFKKQFLLNAFRNNKTKQNPVVLGTEEKNGLFPLFAWIL